MWCNHCHYGGENAILEKGTRCPQCGGRIELTKCPFPDKPKEGKGSGRPRRRKAEYEEET